MTAKIIQRNRHASGRLGNMLFGVAQIADGIVRLLSLGFLHTRVPLELSRLQAKRVIERMRSAS
jgi:hypothetical protein